jgi:S1-C subfamily serine protease
VSGRRGGAALLGAAALAAAGCGGGEGAERPVAPPALLAVTVRAAGAQGEMATAFAVGDGRAVTVAHAVGPRRSVLVSLPGEPARRARVVRADARLDLALLAVPGLEAPAVATAGARANEPARVLVVRDGRPRALRASVHRTITARVRDSPGAAPQDRPALELDGSVMQGDSGAPVVDGDGRVVGMVFAQAEDRDDVAYALDAREIGSP